LFWSVNVTRSLLLAELLELLEVSETGCGAWDGAALLRQASPTTKIIAVKANK
jgi:hypothetical protein